jgi:hypothetical protein
MVPPQLVGTEHSFILVSGESRRRFETFISQTLKPLGAVQYVGEEVASAALQDIAGLVSMYGMFSGAFIAMALLKRQIIPKNERIKVAPAVNKVILPLLQALVPYVGLIAQSIDDESWDENFGNPMSMQVAAMNNIIATCEEEGVDVGSIRYFAGLMRRVVQERGGESGIAILETFLTD